MPVKRAAEAMMDDHPAYDASETIIYASPPPTSSFYEYAQMPDFLLDMELPAYVPYQNCPEADMDVDESSDSTLKEEETDDEGVEQNILQNSLPTEAVILGGLDDPEERRARVEADFESSRQALTRTNVLPFVRGGLTALYRFISLSTGVRHESTERLGFRGEGTLSFDERTFTFEFEPSRSTDYPGRVICGDYANPWNYPPDHFYKASENLEDWEKEAREMRFPDAMYSCAKTLDDAEYEIERSFHKLRVTKQCWDRARQDLADERSRNVVAKREAYERALIFHAHEAKKNGGKPKGESSAVVQEDIAMTETLPIIDLRSIKSTTDMSLELHIAIKHHQMLPTGVQSRYTPTLMGMPTEILQRIFQHVINLPNCKDLWRSGHNLCGAPLAPLPGENDEQPTTERLRARVVRFANMPTRQFMADHGLWTASRRLRQLMFERYTVWGHSVEIEIEAAARANPPKNDGILRPKANCHHRPDPEDWRNGKCMYLNNSFYHQLAWTNSGVRRMQRRVLGIRVGNHGSAHETDPEYLVQLEESDVSEEAKGALALAQSHFKQI